MEWLITYSTDYANETEHNTTVTAQTYTEALINFIVHYKNKFVTNIQLIKEI